MNQHPLTEDMRMYYGQTYIFREKDGKVEAMLVENTEAVGDDRLMDGFEFIGLVFTSDTKPEDAVYGRFLGSDMIEYRPFSGYYDLSKKGLRNRYVTFAVNNRSQRKGLDPRNILINGAPSGLHGWQIVELYEQSQQMCSNPASRDIFVTKAGEVHWKGQLVGTLGKEGKFTSNENHKPVEELVCRLLQNI